MKLISFLKRYSERSEESSAAGALTMKQCSNVAMRSKSGFTLLELLVVIAIIAILIALGTISYSTAQKKSRDAKRHSDLKEIQNALETYHAVEGEYPGGTYPDGIDNSTYFSTGGAPTDPKLGATQDYIEATYETDSYSICADEEVDGTFDGSNQDTCVSSLQ